MGTVREKPETRLVRQCLKYLELLGIPAWRNNVGAMKRRGRFIRFGMAGAADILGCLPPGGRFVALEVKVRPNKVTPRQEAFLAGVREAGGIGAVVYSLDDLEKAINGL